MPLDFEKIKRLREERGLSLQAAAEKAGIGDRQRWHAIESGRITNVKLDTLEAIAGALGVKAKDLLK